jgi:hypothetical protein
VAQEGRKLGNQILVAVKVKNDFRTGVCSLYQEMYI